MSENFWKWAVILATSGVTTTLSHAAIAQIVPDATLGVESTILTPNADVRGLPASLIEGGATRGVNLFQSFSEFNVGDGQRVYFNNPTGIENILTRVTGSGLSNILGTLGVDGQANLFLLNPNGIVFGPNAQLDVAGSFLGTTANSFVWENGLSFSATNPEPAPLIAVTLVPGLQYGANSPGDITSTGNLTVGQDLTLAGGNLNLQGNLQAGSNLTLKAQDTVNINGSYSTTGGNFNIEQLDGSLGNLGSNNGSVIRASGDVSFASYTGASLHILAGGSVNIPGQVEITGAAPTNGLTETITLSDDTQLNIDGKNSPTLDIRAGTTAFDPTGLIPNPIPGIDPPEPIDPIPGIDPPEPIDPIPGIDPPPSEPIEPIPGIVTPTNFGNEPTSADIKIGGIFNISGVESNSGQILLTNQYHPNELAGNIESGTILTYGDVIIDARNNIEISGNIDTTINDSVNANRTAGNIKLFAEENMIIGADLLSNVNGTADSPVGNGGKITLISKNGTIDTTSGNINSKTPNGIAGDVTLESAGNISVGNIEASSNTNSNDPNFSTISMKSREGSVQLDGTRLSTSNSGSGLAGDIIIDAKDEVSIINSSSPDATPEEDNKLGIFSQGNSGNIFIGTNFTPEKVTIDNSELNSEVLGGTGDAGNIIINAGSISLNNSQLITDNNGSGLEGSIEVIASHQNVSMENSAITSESNNDQFPDDDDKEPFILLAATQGSVLLNQSRLSTNNSGSGLAGDIEINAKNVVSILNSNENNKIFNDKETGLFSEGNFGRIFIGLSNVATEDLSPQNVTIDNSTLSTKNSGSGFAGDIEINAHNSIEINNHSKIKSEGNFGRIFIGSSVLSSAVVPPKEVMINNSDLNTSNSVTSGGDSQIINDRSGDISINSQEKISFNNALITTSTFGEGNAGKIDINTNGSVSVDNAKIFSSVRNGAIGNAGNIQIQADSLDLKNGAELNTDTSGEGNAGFIDIKTNGSVSVENAKIVSEVKTEGTGNAGNINIQTDSLDLKNSSEISTSTSGNGNAQDILITANKFVSLSNFSNINSSVREDGKGEAGEITINAQTFEALNVGQVLTTTTDGNAGNITLNVTDKITISGSSPESNIPESMREKLISFDDENKSKIYPSGLFANTTVESTGKGGSINNIGTNIFEIIDGAKITVDSQGTGDAGDITLTANRLILNNKAEISANTSSGNGGTITLDLEDFLLMRRQSQISTSAGEEGTGGDGGQITINLSPDNGFIVSPLLENNDIKANAFFGTGGQIDITARGILGLTVITREDLQRELGTDDPRELDPARVPTNDITAISQNNPNLNGNVNVNSPEIDPNQAIVNLPANTIDTSKLIVQACAAGDGTIAGEFVDTGRGGLPSRPDEPLSGNAVWEDIRLRRTTTQEPIPSNIQNTAPSTQQVAVIVPATGWLFNDKGEVTLISQTNQDNLAPNWSSSSSCVSANRR
ncbi:filamentous hemagglutinin N-terminal domain-containing protein [Nodularia sphaerocarpa]|uniref:two-partner secretion domain-containing protein n=1 Tax=Nodularia sphaerocarpa TaxID=137816 RepID=UPI001EFB0DBB|nr:filamentous hemagglutinin N-terminal domain-containing protein [Nodularia sphaerocarpa]MDB9373355.1 filamentous hemagglutinin N-terminal domain-containing protein [Nodularia sphaerocarpa CS-585]MDB9378811.1 filamentous hemagglutinin N-terminal domain-containing protein [Nodularia sphaerocarpa CS-585A2]ULP71944.1 hypothetical protein BDGGKGIB_01581 [Nodularia sphaerocarpa UHCC 0038]